MPDTQEPTMTERTENEHVDAITKILDEIGKNVIPVGKIVRSSTTIGTCPADINYIRRHLDALAARLAAAEAERDAERARANRLRVAVRKAADRELSRIVTDEVNRREGDMPSREWVSLRKGTIESNHYANDGLEFGDMDGSTDDAE